MAGFGQGGAGQGGGGRELKTIGSVVGRGEHAPYDQVIVFVVIDDQDA